MASVNVEIRFDSEGFQKELWRQVALTGYSEENIERIAIELVNSGKFVHIGPEDDILDAEIIE